MEKKTSPLKGKPLRLAGQSVDEHINEIINNDVSGYLIALCFSIFLAAFEWWQWSIDSPPKPIPLTIATVIIASFCIPKILKARRLLRNLKQGRDGERAVGQYLEKLQQEGCVVLHDIVAENFNIDHVVISEKGIYLIETKTYSKPHRARPRVRYNNDKLIIDGLGDKSEILDQVKGATSWLRRMLEDSTGKVFLIKPVILFPGWYVESNQSSSIWVLEPKAFPKFLATRKEIVSKEDKKLAAYHMSRYIRAL